MLSHTAVAVIVAVPLWESNPIGEVKRSKLTLRGSGRKATIAAYNT